MKKIIAITGKIGAGKSSLISNLEKAFSVFSVDKIQKKLYQPKNKLWQMVDKNFPEFIVDCYVDYSCIKKRIIQDTKFKIDFQEQVIDILIPEIQAITKDLSGLIFVEIPYINSEKLSKLFDVVAVVEAKEQTRIKRIAKRDNISEEQAKIWSNSYVPNIEFDKTITITNDATLADLERKLTEVFKCIVL